MRIWPLAAIGLLACTLCPAADEGDGGLTVEVHPPAYQRVVTFDRDEIGPTITLKAFLDHLQQRFDPEAREHRRLRPISASIGERELDLPPDGLVLDMLVHGMLHTSTLAQRLRVFRSDAGLHPLDRHGHAVAGPLVLMLSYIEPLEDDDWPPGLRVTHRALDFQRGVLVLHGLHRTEDVDPFHAMREIQLVLEDGDTLPLRVWELSGDFGRAWVGELPPEKWQQVRSVEGTLLLHPTLHILRLRVASDDEREYHHEPTGLRVRVRRGDADGNKAERFLRVQIESAQELEDEEVARLVGLAQAINLGQMYAANPAALLDEADAAFVAHALPRLRQFRVLASDLLDRDGEPVQSAARSGIQPGEATVTLERREDADHDAEMLFDLAETRLQELEFTITRNRPADQ